MKCIILALAGLITLSACVSLSYLENSPDKTQWKQQLIQLNAITHWEIRGKLSLRRDNEIITFDIFWKQQQRQQTIRLVAPLGQGATELTGNAEDGYTVVTNHGEKIRVDSPESVSLHAFGVALPFADMQYWLKGMPSPQGRVWQASFDPQNLLTMFQQNGWNIELKKYTAVGTRQLPEKIFIQLLAESDAVVREKTDVRLFIRQWILDGV